MILIIYITINASSKFLHDKQSKLLSIKYLDGPRIESLILVNTYLYWKLSRNKSNISSLKGKSAIINPIIPSIIRGFFKNGIILFFIDKHP